VNREKARIFKDKSGISPVVATVILVAVTIVVGWAVAYWMGGIAVLYTRFERLEILSAYAIWNAEGNNWTVTVNLRNTGSADTTITGLFINGKPWNDASFWGNVTITTPSDFSSKGLFIPSGRDGKLVFNVEKGGGFNSGVSIGIKLYSPSGQDHYKTITLD